MEYDSAFYGRAEQSAAAASLIIAILQSYIEIQSVLDVGCARGTWLCAWAHAGCTDLLGIDSNSGEPESFLLSSENILVADLTLQFDLGRRFDLAQCLEVAEHLPAERANSLVADLTAHSDIILFSAAPPGQGGEFHVNEQPYEYWRMLFAAQGYSAFDCIRPKIKHATAIPYWYRYNTVLYANEEGRRKLSPDALSGRLTPDAAIADISTPLFRIRKMALRLLPLGMVSALSKINSRLSRPQ
jgi:hypothetical protein